LSVTAARNSRFNTILSSLLIRPFQTNLDFIQGDRKVSRYTKKGVRHFNTLDFIPQADSCDEMHFVQDTASPHFAISVRTWLDSHLNIRWIGRWGTEEGLPIHTKNTKLTDTTNSRHFCLSLSNSYRKNVESGLSKLQKFVKNAVAY